jgi:2-polyprenyl-6-methoxyphenol hydroxylase-like FAD-dependent oxidoreductase
VCSKDQLSFASYGDGGLWRFNKGRVVLIGDCSHSMSPQLGQGCNLALIDAEKMVDCFFAARDTNDTAYIPQILEEYTRRRWSHIQFYALQSRILTPIFASRSKVLCFLRDTLMAKMCTSPVLTTYVHGVLCGAQSTIPFVNIPEHEWLGFLEEEIAKENENNSSPIS